MVLNITFTDTDEAKCTEIVKSNGIQIAITLVLVREALIVKIPEHNKLTAQSTAKVNIEIIITGRNLHVVTKADAFAASVRELKGASRHLKVFNAPPGTAFDATDYTRALTTRLAREVLAAAMCQLRFDERSEIGKTLDDMGEVAQKFALSMNVMKMEIKGPEPHMTAEHCSMSCETVQTTYKWRPPVPSTFAHFAVPEGNEMPQGVKVTTL